MKEWTRGEVERLVPEHSVVCTSIMFDEDSAEWERCIVRSLLQTRLDLENLRINYQAVLEEWTSESREISRLRKALERIADPPTTLDWMMVAEIAREALKGHDK